MLEYGVGWVGFLFSCLQCMLHSLMVVVELRSSRATAEAGMANSTLDENGVGMGACFKVIYAA